MQQKQLTTKKKRNDAINKWRKKFHREQNVCYICKNRLSTNDNNKRYYKVRDHCHYKGKYTGSAYNICNLRYITRREIPVVFYNGFIYDYHSIIKELAEEIWESIWIVGRKHRKVHNFFSTN